MFTRRPGVGAGACATLAVALGLIGPLLVACEDPTPARPPNTDRTGGSGGRAGSGGRGGSGGSAGGAGLSGGAGSGGLAGLAGSGGAQGGAGAGGAGGEADGSPGEVLPPSGDDGGPDEGAPEPAVDAAPEIDMAPPPPRCGDGKVDPGEACDHGAMNANNQYGEGKCLRNCQKAPFCGDGTRQNPEACDSGAANSDTATGANGCTKSCRRPPYCGDNNRDPGEACDNGNANLSSTAEYSTSLTRPRADNRPHCNSACKVVSYCGDMTVQAGNEACEPPNTPPTATTAGCSASCTRVPPPVCGNGMREAGEACDNGAGNQDVAEYVPPPGRAEGQTPCNRSCRVIRFCGDGTTDGANGEACDNGSMNSNTAGGGTACTSACKRPACGDGFKQDHEECDNGPRNVTVGYRPSPPAAGEPPYCRAPGAGSASCKPVPFCGDGRVSDGEACGPNATGESASTCTATCTRPATSSRKTLAVASAAPGDCPSGCVADVNSSTGILVSCKGPLPSAPPYRLPGTTKLTFAPAGGTVEGQTDLTLAIGDGGAYSVSCDRPGGTFPLLNQAFQPIPSDCANNPGGIAVNITNTGPTPSCVRLNFARVDATVRP